MIYVIATIEVTEGQRDEFVNAFCENVPKVLAEEGCMAYEPTIDFASDVHAQPDPRPNVVTIVEKWESHEALKAHLVAPHMVSFRESVKAMLKDISIQILEPVSSP